MSADNWAVCPFCVQQKALGLKNREAELTAAYGKVPVEQFDAMREEVAAYRDVKMERTFREDYEIGLYDPEEGSEFTVMVRYKGRCTVCNLSHEIRDDQQIVVHGDPSQDRASHTSASEVVHSAPSGGAS